MKKPDLKNVFFYADAGKEDYEMVEPNIIFENRVTLMAFSALAATLLLAKFVMSSFAGMNCKIYGIGAIASLAIFLISVGPVKRHEALVMPLVYVSYSAYCVFGMLIGTLTEPDQKNVLFMGMMIFLSMLFVGRPIQFGVLTTVHVAIYICLCLATKTGSVLSGDIANAMIFGFAGIAGGTSITCFRVRGYVTQKDLRDANEVLKNISRHDTLTDMQNRDAYNADFPKIAESCERSLACVFIDVNGLKYINDNEGHEKGDEMLKTVADEIKNHFGDDFTYRIGGDEFVIFVPDPEEKDIKDKTDDILAKIKVKSYYAAVGWKIRDLNDNLHMEELVKDAEAYMYKKKSEFYKQSKFDRRTN